MATELSSIMATNGRVVDWAGKVKYNMDLTNEDKEISNVFENWAKELGKNGHDKDWQLSQLIEKTITPEVVETPSTFIERMFNTGTSIGEFDDYRSVVTPENTFTVHDSIPGGNVDRSFIDHKVLKPESISLQVETDITLQDIRKGGYKTVANFVSLINEKLEYQKVARIINIVDNAIANGAENYFDETTNMPTETAMKNFALYLHDVANGDTPIVFGLNKYIQAISGLPGATTYLTEAAKNQYNKTGFLKEYAGLELFGLSGQKKLVSGDNIIPNLRLFGAAGIIGDVVTQGSTRVTQETDNNSEKIHVIVRGYDFKVGITDISKVAKMTIAG